MSESNNNVPMRITQLEEATVYEDGMYYAVAKAGNGTKKISTEKLNLKETEIFDNIYYNEPELNLADPEVAEEGAIQEDGSIATNGIWGLQVCGKYIEIESDTTYVYSDSGSGIRFNLVLFDEDKNVISGTYVTDTYYITFTTPSNAKYIRYSWNKNKLPMLTKGSDKIPYVAYKLKYINKMLLNINGEEKTTDEAFSNYISKDIEIGKNLVDPSKIQNGKFIDSSGNLVNSSNYSTSDYIPLKANQSITVSPKIRAGILYKNDKSALTSSYVNTTEWNPITFTATEDGFLRVSFYLNDTTKQAEYGTSATTYEPFIQKTVVEKNVHLSETMRSDVENVILSGNGTLQVSKYNDTLAIISNIEGNVLERSYSLNGFGARNKNFNFNRALLNGTEIKNSDDDITPQRIKVKFGGTESELTVGANHGYPTLRIEGTNLTEEDSGSIWTDGSTQYTFLYISNNYSYFSYPCYVEDNLQCFTTTAPSGDLTHVSGATHTSNISITGNSRQQFYPSINNISIKFYIDNKLIEADGSFSGNQVSILEKYQIINFVDLVTYLQSNIGSSISDIIDSIDSIAELTNLYQINEKTEQIYTTLKALDSIVLTNSGFLQADIIKGKTNCTRYRYANGVKSSSYFNSRNLVNMDSYNTSRDILLSDMDDSNIPTNRCVDLLMDSNDKILYGFAFGFIPDLGDSADEKRKSLTTLWDMRDSKKSYPKCIVNKSLSEGECVNISGYRSYIMPNQKNINETVIPVDTNYYIFIDSQSAFTENITIPKYGAKTEEINSQNTTVSDFVCADGLYIASSNSYSYSVFKTI